MAKSPDAFRTISEVAEWLDKPAHVLRFWESKFTQVKPVKRAGGRRYYRPDDMLLLGGIKKLLHDDGMTIKGVQKILREQGIKHVAALSQPLDEIAEAAARGDMIDGKPDTDPQQPTPTPPAQTPAQVTTAGTSDTNSADDETVVAFQRAADPVSPQTTEPPPDAPFVDVPDAEDSGDIAPALPFRAPGNDASPDRDRDDPDTGGATAHTPETSDHAASKADTETGTDVTDDDATTGGDAEPSRAAGLPSFLRKPQPDTDDDSPSTETAQPENTAPASTPNVIDVPDTPPLDQIDAGPGLLSAIVKARAPLTADTRHGLAAARDQLAQLRARLAQSAKD